MYVALTILNAQLRSDDMAGRSSLYVASDEPTKSQAATAEKNGKSNWKSIEDSSSDQLQAAAAAQKSFDWVPALSRTVPDSIAAATPRDNNSHDIAKDEIQHLTVAAAVVKLPCFTLDQLADFDGSKPELPLYVALLGDVYDVTAGRKFYGPGGPYAVFAGRDATRGLATFRLVFKINELSKHCYCDLSERHLNNAKRWRETFKNKYRVVGTLIVDCNCPEPAVSNSVTAVVVNSTVTVSSSSSSSSSNSYVASGDQLRTKSVSFAAAAAAERPTNSILSGLCSLL